MNLKKIIAREFLILLGVILLLSIGYGGFSIFNRIQQNRADKVHSDISKLVEQYQSYLSKPFQAKDEYLTQEKLDEFSVFVATNPTATKQYIYDLIPELNHDSILLKRLSEYGTVSLSLQYKNKKEQNINFPEFFIFNQSDVDSMIQFHTKIEELKQEELKFKNSNIPIVKIKDLIYQFGIWIFSLIFGIRYLFYATQWSLRNVKSND